MKSLLPADWFKPRNASVCGPAPSQLVPGPRSITSAGCGELLPREDSWLSEAVAVLPGSIEPVGELRPVRYTPSSHAKNPSS